jgi:hypothetical protein
LTTNVELGKHLSIEVHPEHFCTIKLIFDEKTLEDSGKNQIFARLSDLIGKKPEF